MNSVPLLRFLLSSLPFLRGLAWVAEGGGVGCRWSGRGCSVGAGLSAVGGASLSGARGSLP